MKTHKLILIIISLIFTLPSCMTMVLSEAIEKKYSADNEFAKHYKVDTNIIAGKENNVNIFEGVYLGKTEKKKTSYYNLQFSGMLNGENRVLDVYIEPKQDTFPYFREVKEMEQGVPAYLFINPNYGNGTRFTMFYSLFDTYSNNKSIEPFLDLIEKDKSQLSDTTFLITLYYPEGASDPTNIVTNIYTKNNDGSFSLEQIRKREYYPEVFFKLKYKTRKRYKKAMFQSLYIFSVLGDIITFPFQLYIYIDFQKNGFS